MFRIRDMHYPRGTTYLRHAHDEVQVSIIVRGGMIEDAAGRRQPGSTGDVVVKPAGTLHADEFDATRIICLDFQPDAVDVGGYAWHRLDRASMAGFRLVQRYLSGADVTQDIDELLAALPGRPLRDRAAATRAAEMLRTLNVADTARELDLHPVYLTRIFTEQWRCTPREYRNRLRIHTAMRAITSTTRPLADIALEAGFSDQAHMTRALSKATGLAPAALRRMAAG
jgi:AraC family transcriptional regulator